MVRIHDMEADMAFEHLRHEGIDGAAACGNGMKNLGTFGFGDQGALDSLDLSPDTPDSIQHFFLVADYVSHLAIYYTQVGYPSTFSFGGNFHITCRLYRAIHRRPSRRVGSSVGAS